MGKRSDFDRNPRDFYPTPPEAVAPLWPHLPERFTYVEPCAGAGDLVAALEANPEHEALCLDLYDIEPQAQHVRRCDALSVPVWQADFIITNPPWHRETLHRMITHFSAMRPTWLLLDADWMHTKQSAPYLEWCRKIVSVGRVKWIPGSAHTGKDNCVWYLFDQHRAGPCVFVGRMA